MTTLNLRDPFLEALHHAAPAWEAVAGVTFAGARSRHRLSLRFTRDMDWGPLEAEVRARWAAGAPRGRLVHFAPREVALEVSGKSGELPEDDGGVQRAVLTALHAAAAEALSEAGTERWTDGPFEDPPERVREGDGARTFLDDLVATTVTVRVVALDFFSDQEAPNPEVTLSLEGAHNATSLDLRRRRLPQSCFVRPGVLRFQASAGLTAFPGYRSHFAPWARQALWTSPPVTLEVRPFETVALGVGLANGDRTLTPEEQAFFAQPFRAPSLTPPPPPREVLVIARR